MIAPNEPIEVIKECPSPVEIRWVDKGRDDDGTTDLFADLDGDAGTGSDRILIAEGLPVQKDVQHLFEWNAAVVEPGDYHVLVVSRDRNATGFDFAPGIVSVRGIQVSMISGDDVRVNDIAVFDDGSFVVAGSFLELVRFDPGLATEQFAFALGNGAFLHRFDALLARYSEDFELEWITRAGGDGDDAFESVEAANDGSILVTGRYRSRAVFGFGEANETELVGTLGKPNPFVARYHADGRLHWARSMTATLVNPGTQFELGGASLHGAFERPDGSVLALGAFSGGELLVDADDAGGIIQLDGNGPLSKGLAVIYSADGDVESLIENPLPTPGPSSLSTFSDGTLLVGQGFTDTILIGSGNQAVGLTATAIDGYLARMTPDFQPIWVVHLGGEGDQRFSPTVGPDDIVHGIWSPLAQVLLTDADQQVVQIDIEVGELNYGRFSADGTFEDAFVPLQGDDFVHFGALIPGASGTFTLTGGFANTTAFGRFDPQIVQNGGPSDAFIAHFESDGALDWLRTLASPGFETAGVAGGLPDGGVVVLVNNDNAFNPELAGGACNPTVNALDVSATRFLARFSADGEF